MSHSKATSADAELILKLYDLRRESVMRKARAFVAGLNPQSVDELVKLANAWGTEENAFFRQVTSFWEMAASFVLHDALHEQLFLDNAGEMLFIFAKLQPFLPELREKLGSPTLLAKAEELINRSPDARTRLHNMIERQKRLFPARAAAAAAGKQK